MRKNLAAYGAAFVLLAAGILFAPIAKVHGSGYTTLWSQWIQNSLIDSTPIGSTTPSTGAFTALTASSGSISSLSSSSGAINASVGATTANTGNFSTLTLNGAGPVGYTLCGNGTSYVPCGSSTAVDDYFSFTGCSVNNSGNLNACTSSVTFTSGGNTSPTFAAMPDTNYQVFCTVDTGTSSSASFSLSGGATTGDTPEFTRTTSGFSYVYTSVMSLGASGSASPLINCHLHHN